MRSQLSRITASLITSVVTAVLTGLVTAQNPWQELGPAPITNGPYTGRVAAVAASRTNANLWYVGGADGGVWKTTDAGSSWTPIGDFLPTTATGALAVHPTDDKILWVGTGEANFAHHSRYGLGMAKTVDGGSSWVVYGQREFAGRCVSRIQVDPKSPNTLYASTTHAGGFLPKKSAARRHPDANGPIGVFKSTDAGVTWTQLGGGLPTTVSVTDLVLDPSNPKVLYAAVGDIFGDARNGVYKTSDGGASWNKLSGGLPTSSVGRISLALAASRPSRVLAIVVRPSSASSGSASTRGVWLSDDGGASWADRTSAAGSFQATYGWYLSVAAIDPKQPDNLVLGGFSIRRSTNGGVSFATRTTPHVDIHAFDFDAAGRLICGNDGGVHVTSNLGDRWSARNDGLGLIQIYAGISLDPRDPQRVWAGFQDNGSCQRTSGKNWSRVLGGDGGHTGVDPTGTRVFVESQGTGNLYRSTSGGRFSRVRSGISTSDRNCFLPPLAIDPTNPLRMIYGTQRVYESQNGGTSWSPISGDLTGGSPAAIHGLEIAPSDGRFLYVRTNDGRVQVSENGGQSWALRLTGVPSWVRTTRPFAVDATQASRVWLASGSFGPRRVLYSADAGRAWQDRTGDLPDIPVHCVALDPTHGAPAIVYVGSDLGVWRSLDDGKNWRRYGENLPHAAIVDLRLDTKLQRLVAGTQGRGVWQTVLLDRDEKFSEAIK